MPFVLEMFSTRRSPIAQVAEIMLDQIKENHILRDRISLNIKELASLKASIAARGQQTLIEVVETGRGEYGLISGLRRPTTDNVESGATGNVEAERKILDRVLRKLPQPSLADKVVPRNSPMIMLKIKSPGEVILSGKGVTRDFLNELQEWLEKRG